MKSFFRIPLGSVTLCCIVLSGLTVVSQAADSLPLSWPMRNGPTMNGHVADADAQGLPIQFDETSGKNIQWKMKLDGLGHSTAVIGHGKVWLTAATEDGEKQYVYGIDAESGEVLHHKLFSENANPEPLGNNVNTYASPSCVLEDDAVYVHFGTYGTARLNPETAEIVWERKDINGRHFRGPGSSPVVFENLIILTFDCIDAQFLIALNKQTGETVWRTERTTDYGDLDENGKPKRDGDLRKGYSTPGLIEVNGRTQVVSVGSRAGFAYDALTGQEIWSFRHDDFNAAAPPSFYKNFAILNTGARGANLLAVELNETTKGDITDSHVKWNRLKGNSRLATPLLVGNCIYMVTDTGVANCIDADTGDEIWKGRIGGTHVASPITANDLIYFFSEEGDVTVIKTGDTFEVVAKNTLNEGSRASLAAAKGRLYLRTFGHLYCIGHDGVAN